jgi:mobilome CxxCx(11)CxxC protein
MDKHTEDKIQECWDKALHDYGTGYIFEQRANRYRRRLKILNFLGIAVPASAGALFLSFETSLYSIVAPIAGVLGLAELIGSIWSLTNKWSDIYAYALESMTSNYNLAEDYKRLAKNHDLSNFSFQFEIIQVRDQIRRDSDYKQGITEDEKRMGMRAALRERQLKCATCDEMPKSMEPSDCDTCGNFKRRKW